MLKTAPRRKRPKWHPALCHRLRAANTTRQSFSLAVPGWYFDSWNSGYRFFCRGSSDPVCILSLQEHTENKAVGEIVASSETFYLMPVFKQLLPDFIAVEGRTVNVEGREWLLTTMVIWTKRIILDFGRGFGSLLSS